MGRKLKIHKINEYPSGHPYVLYVVQEPRRKPKYTVAITEYHAKTQLGVSKAKAFPVSVKSLTDQFGHSQANAFLKQFGNEWLCKEGKVFYNTKG